MLSRLRVNQLLCSLLFTLPPKFLFFLRNEIVSSLLPPVGRVQLLGVYVGRVQLFGVYICSVFHQQRQLVDWPLQICGLLGSFVLLREARVSHKQPHLPHKIVLAGHCFNYPCQLPVASHKILFLQQYYISHLNVSLFLIPLLSNLSICQIFPFPPRPKLVRQILHASPSFSGIDIFFLEVSWWWHHNSRFHCE